MLWKATVIGFNNYADSIDEDLFENLELPSQLDREVVINQILLTTGELPVAYPDYDFLKSQIGLWSKQKLPIFNHMVELLELEFNPLHNYDRYEEYNDNESSSSTDVNQSYNQSSNYQHQVDDEDYEEDASDTNDVSAYDSNNYSKDRKSTIDKSYDRDYESTINGTSNNTNNSTLNNSTSKNFNHNAHLYGNIGITTSVDMLRQAKEWYETDIPQIIAEEFKCDFCLGIY